MQVPMELKQKKVRGSKVLETIVNCLENEKYPHVLYWFNKMKWEFIIKFVHKSNPEWKADDLELFKELDKLSKNYEEYLQDKDYETKCKGRCRANLLKLVNNECLTCIKDIQNGSIILKKYRINVKVVPSIKKLINRKQTEGSCNNKLNRYKSVDGITDNEVRIKTETQPNEQSHYLCLPKFQPIYVYVNLFLGGAPISNLGMPSTNSTESPMIDTNSNDSDANGKSVNSNGDIESMNVNGASIRYPISEYGGLQNNMNVHDGLQNNMNVHDGLQNNMNVHDGYQFGISTNSTESPMVDMSNYNSDASGKSVNSNGNIESMNDRLQNNMNVHYGYRNDGCLMSDAAVPSSPENVEAIFNTLSSDCYSDYDKDIDNLLQQDLLCDLSNDFSSYSLFEGSDCLLSDKEARAFVI